MARSAFNAITTWDRLHLRTDSYGPSDALTWPEANGGSDATPIGTVTYNSDILGDGSGAGWELTAAGNGVDPAGASSASGNDFTAFCVFIIDAVTASFRVVIGDDNDNMSVYHDGSTLYLFDASNFDFIQTSSTATVYRLIWVRDDTTGEYRVYVNGSLLTTSGSAPAAEVMGFEFGSSNGSALDGDLICFGVADGVALSGAAITSLDNALADEVLGIGDGGGSVEAYDDTIANLNADHLWTFDGNSNDSIGSANGTNTGITFTANPLTRSATNIAQVDAVGDRVSIPTTATINNSTQTRKAISGWFETTAIQQPFTRIYGEGNQTTNFQFVMGFGNFITLEVRDGANFQIQIYTDRSLVPSRVYHLCAVFEGNGFGNRVDLFLDGVRQTNADPTDRQPDDADLASRGVAEFADPAGTVGLDGSTLLIVGPAQQGVSRYAYWAAWDGANAVLSDDDVRIELFEKGALADNTISADTEANMQTAIDLLASTTRSDAACCIEVEAATDMTNFTLDLDDITFDALASIHVRYNGTVGMLTVRNTNGSNASIGSAPFGGSISIVTEQTITVTCLDASTGSPVSGARVLLEAGAGGDLAEGTPIIDKLLTNGSGVASTTFDFSADQPVVGRARKASASPRYKTGQISGTITSAGFDVTVFLVPDD